MKSQLFNLMVVSEPDRQRLARFTIESVDTLGGNLFAAAVAIEKVLLELYSQAGTEAQIENVTSCVKGQIISLTWGASIRCWAVCLLRSSGIQMIVAACGRTPP